MQRRLFTAIIALASIPGLAPGQDESATLPAQLPTTVPASQESPPPAPVSAGSAAPAPVSGESV